MLEMSEGYAKRRARCPGIVCYLTDFHQLIAATLTPVGLIKFKLDLKEELKVDTKYGNGIHTVDATEYVDLMRRICAAVGTDALMRVKFIYRGGKLSSYFKASR